MAHGGNGQVRQPTSGYGTFRTWLDVRIKSAIGREADNAASQIVHLAQASASENSPAVDFRRSSAIAATLKSAKAKRFQRHSLSDVEEGSSSVTQRQTNVRNNVNQESMIIARRSHSQRVR
jgi:hypothetical protein